MFHAQTDQNSNHTNFSPPLPPRTYRGYTETDSNRCHNEQGDAEVKDVDLTELNTVSAASAPSQEETETDAGKDRAASEADTSSNVAPNEHLEGEWQERTCQKDGEDEEKDVAMDGENKEGEIERSDVKEEERVREGNVQHEGIAETEMEGDGEGETECEQRDDGNEGEWKEKEGECEERERLPMEEEEEKQGLHDRLVTDGENADAEDSRDKRSIGQEEEEGREMNEAFVSTGEASAVDRQEEREELEEAHPVVEHLKPTTPKCLMESQTVQQASGDTENAKQLTVKAEVVEECEQKDKHVSEVEEGVERSVEEEERDRESKADGEVMVLGPSLGRTLVVSKQVPAKTHHVKAVPVVPPKPQQSRLTALGLRQQMQSRDMHNTKQRDREAPHTQDTHNADANTPQENTHSTDTKSLQPGMQTPEQDPETTPDPPASDTKSPNTLQDDQQHQGPAHTRHTDSPAAPEDTGVAQLYTADDPTQPYGPQTDPATPDTDQYPPHIVINQHQPQPETPDPLQHCTAELHTSHRETERESGMGEDGGGARYCGGKSQEGSQEELRDAQVAGGKGPPCQQTETGRDSPDIKKDASRLHLREGERERRPRERDVKKNSGMSMCFDEAVARATREREREREHSEREKERERGVNLQDEKARL